MRKLLLLKHITTIFWLAIPCSDCLAQSRSVSIADGQVNAFDLENLCWSANGDGLNLIRSFGYISPGRTAGRWAFLTSGFYVITGGTDDVPNQCEKQTYLYTVGNGLLKREQISDIESSKTIVEFQKNKSALSPAIDVTEPAEIEEVGSCLFPLYWYEINGKQFALLVSTYPELGSFVGYVDRDETKAGKACQSWKGAQYTHSYLISDSLNAYHVDHKQIFVSMTHYALAGVFNATDDLQSKRGDGEGAISRMILLDRRSFSKIKPQIDSAISEATKYKSLDYEASSSLTKRIAEIILAFADRNESVK